MGELMDRSVDGSIGGFGPNHLWVGVWVAGWMGGWVGQWLGTGQTLNIE